MYEEAKDPRYKVADSYFSSLLGELNNDIMRLIYKSIKYHLFKLCYDKLFFSLAVSSRRIEVG